MDFIAQVLWYASFATPILIIPLAWQKVKAKPIYRILLGLLGAALLSFFLYFLSLAILFRDGMGPT